jgi:hypothetical protein
MMTYLFVFKPLDSEEETPMTVLGISATINESGDLIITTLDEGVDGTTISSMYVRSLV